MKTRVLVVEDEAPIREGLLDRLRREGFDGRGAEDGESAVTTLTTETFDLVILDLMLPGISGEDVLIDMRRRSDLTPVLVLSARGQEVDRVLLLTLGADDYVVKPFSVRELIARIRAILRRTSGRSGTETARFADVTLDFDGFRIIKGDTVHPITATERGMLELLWSRRGRLVSRDEFLGRVWGYERMPETRTVDFHVVRLRRKIEDRPEQPKHLKTVRGRGYLLDPDPS